VGEGERTADVSGCSEARGLTGARACAAVCRGRRWQGNAGKRLALHTRA
jgi:hypothetical protein